MTRVRKIGLIAVVTGLVAVTAFILYAYAIPYLTRSTASESLSDISPGQQTSGGNEQIMQETPAGPVIERTGQFRGAPGKQVSGGVSLVRSDGKYYLRLESSFTTTPAPDLYVGFGNGDTVDTNTLFARLKATNGGQNYEIPSSIDVTQFNQAFIYCKIFVQTYGIADLDNI